MINAELALKALEDARAVQVGVAERARCPPHMHLAFGLLLGALDASPAAPVPYELAILAVAMGCVALMIRWQRRRLGFFVNGYRKGRTLMVTLPLLALTEALLFGGMWLKYARHLDWAPLVSGAVMVVVGTAASYAFGRIYRAELTGKAAGAVL
jgi:hypothetical protein